MFVVRNSFIVCLYEQERSLNLGEVSFLVPESKFLQLSFIRQTTININSFHGYTSFVAHSCISCLPNINIRSLAVAKCTIVF